MGESPQSLIRPVQMEDLDGLAELAAEAGFGLTTLPKDRELLRREVLESVNSFNAITEEPGPESYFFVLEHTSRDQLLGTCRIVAKVGGFEPYYTYRIENSVHESDVLNVRREIPTLHLVAEHDGPTEIGSLFLAPSHRDRDLGRGLSLSRFLFMAEHESFFEQNVIAELRGVIDEDGTSPFWDALGRHFFDVDLPTADHLSMKDKRVIAELMPTHPIYVPLLPPRAQDVLGEVHESTRPALRILRREGFERTREVDIFEAGPTVICPLREIRSVRQSRSDPVEQFESPPASSPACVLAHQPEELSGYRALVAPVEPTESGGIRVSRRVGSLLRIQAGDRVRWVPLDPSTSPSGKES